MNKQQAWDEWHEGILGNKAPDIKLSSHGKAFSAGYEAAMNWKQENYLEHLPAKGKLDAFCAFIGSEPIENDGGWSLEVWNAAWEACKKQAMQVCEDSEYPDGTDLAYRLGDKL